jgi:hypothetical protein
MTQHGDQDILEPITLPTMQVHPSDVMMPSFNQAISCVNPRILDGAMIGLSVGRAAALPRLRDHLG